MVTVEKSSTSTFGYLTPASQAGTGSRLLMSMPSPENTTLPAGGGGWAGRGGSVALVGLAASPGRTLGTQTIRSPPNKPQAVKHPLGRDAVWATRYRHKAGQGGQREGRAGRAASRQGRAGSGKGEGGGALTAAAPAPHLQLGGQHRTDLLGERQAQAVADILRQGGGGQGGGGQGCGGRAAGEARGPSLLDLRAGAGCIGDGTVLMYCRCCGGV